MSSTRSDTFRNEFGQQSEWLEELLATEIPNDGQEMFCQGMEFRLEGRIPTAVGLLSTSQTQTSNSFGYQWQREELFDKKEVLAQVRSWLIERYGEIEEAGWWCEYGDNPVLLDAGCGAAISVIELCGERLNAVRYLGVDVSEAVHVAESRFRQRNLKGMFVRCDLAKVPIEPKSVEVIFSEGVLHHTDSTHEALGRVCTYLKPNGRILFYVYRKKGPVREFVDDHIRAQLSDLPPDQAWGSLGSVAIFV